MVVIGKQRGIFTAGLHRAMNMLVCTVTLGEDSIIGAREHFLEARERQQSKTGEMLSGRWHLP